MIDQLLLTPLESVWDVHPEDHNKGSFELKQEKEHHHHDHDHHHQHHDHEAKDITAMLVKYGSPRGKFTLPSSVNKKDMLMAAEPAVEIQQLFQLIQPAVDVLYKLSWLIFCLAMVSVLITLLNSLKDRKYEIAMMRAGGATPTTVFMSVLIEGALISLIGSFIGIILGHFLMELLANYMISSYNYDFTGLMFYPFEFILILGSLLIGMISALYPAYTAYKLNIAQTLKQS